jgi:hypothetical protein
MVQTTEKEILKLLIKLLIIQDQRVFVKSSLTKEDRQILSEYYSRVA